MSGPLEPGVFFTDRDLGNRFPQILAAAGLTVKKHSDHFRANCPDEEWLKIIGQKGWTAITHDGRIRYKPNELDAVIRNDVALLVVVGKASFQELAQNFVATIPKIMELLKTHSPPLIAKIYRPSSKGIAKDSNSPGSAELWYPKPQNPN